MPARGWINVSVRCSFEQADHVCAAFEHSGSKATTVDRIISEEAAPTAQISGLFEESRYARTTLLNKLRSLPDALEISPIEENRVQDCDWVRLSQSKLRPVRISDRLRIAAPWHADDTDKAVTVQINPSTAFGTGHHPTTRLCLEFLTERNLKGASIIDYGCGSGIVALAGIALGAAFAWGVDIDADALMQSESNARRNGFERKFRALKPEHGIEKRIIAEIVVANLYSDLLCDLAGTVSNMVCDSGWLAVSGILESQTNIVRNAYRNRFDFDMASDGQWTLLAGRKR